jgi:myo-inositol catabolism protein IolC
MKLYILPFDHRGSFVKIVGSSDIMKIKTYKQLIYSAFKKALKTGISKTDVGILIDETYGKEILLDAKKNGLITCYTLEKSGQKEFQFDRKDWKNRLKLFKPNYVKVLIRYNPVNKELNERQAKKLASLSKYLTNQSIGFLLEVLVPATEQQIKKYGGSYDRDIRPKLVFKTLKELQSAGVNPNIWKLEGLDKIKDMQKIAVQVKKFNQSANIVVLGRGESLKKAQEWIKVGARVKAVVGFAVGRTIFQQPLLDYKSKKLSKNQAIEKISQNYLHFVKLFEKVKLNM